MVNQNPQPEVWTTRHSFAAATTSGTTDTQSVFTQQANTEEGRIYALSVSILNENGNNNDVVTYSTGTVTGATTTLTGAGGAAFTPAMIGGQVTATNGVNIGNTAKLVDWTSATVMTMDKSTTIAGGSAYSIDYVPNNTPLAGMSGIDFEVEIQVGSGKVPSQSFSIAGVCASNTKTLTLPCPILVLFQQPISVKVTWANSQDLDNATTVKVSLIGDLSIQPVACNSCGLKHPVNDGCPLPTQGGAN